MEKPLLLAAVLIVLGSLALAAIGVYLAARRAMHERELLSKERLMALEKGASIPLDLPPARRAGNPLGAGIRLLVVGLGLAFALALANPGRHAWVWGVFVATIGLANLVYWLVGGKAEWERQRALDEEVKRAYVRSFGGGPPRSLEGSSDRP